MDFAALEGVNSDIVAWLYGADTGLNYPIVQAEDNDYYLYRLLDGTWNKNGTIFMDYVNRSDFSDQNTLVYGHHMKSGAMFGALVQYKKQEFYDAHPYLYLYTPQPELPAGPDRRAPWWTMTICRVLHGAVGGYGECAGALVPVRVQDAGAGGSLQRPFGDPLHLLV